MRWNDAGFLADITNKEEAWRRSIPEERPRFQPPKKLTDAPPGSKIPRLSSAAAKHTAAQARQQYSEPNCQLRYRWRLACFTDGSVQSGGRVGAAIYRADTPEGTASALMVNPNGVGTADTINRAELAGIYHSVHDVLAPTEEGTIFTDSQVSLCLISKMLRRPWALEVHPHHELIRLIAACLVDRANRGVRTWLLKVPAHSGIEGNECADAAAKEAANVGN